MPFGFNVTSKMVLGFVAGVVIGAVGYKLVSEKKINPKAIEKTVVDLANKFKPSSKEENVQEAAESKQA